MISLKNNEVYILLNRSILETVILYLSKTKVCRRFGYALNINISVRKKHLYLWHKAVGSINFNKFFVLFRIHYLDENFKFK